MNDSIKHPKFRGVLLEITQPTRAASKYPFPKFIIALLLLTLGEDGAEFVIVDVKQPKTITLIPSRNRCQLRLQFRNALQQISTILMHQRV
jgi:hypothetical protein